jgi:hypothetical protein
MVITWHGHAPTVTAINRVSDEAFILLSWAGVLQQQPLPPSNNENN